MKNNNSATDETTEKDTILTNWLGVSDLLKSQQPHRTNIGQNKEKKDNSKFSKGKGG